VGKPTPTKIVSNDHSVFMKYLEAEKQKAGMIPAFLRMLALL